MYNLIYYSFYLFCSCYNPEGRGASSNINEVIRSVLNIFFFYDKISQVQKSIKTQFEFFINVTLKPI